MHNLQFFSRFAVVRLENWRNEIDLESNATFSKVGSTYGSG